MATMTIDLAHLVQVVTDDHDDGLGHRAECSCGWSSDWHGDDDLAAEAAGVDHREIAVRPGDGLDAVMGELLDLQDDLTQAVIWLAKNWAADLPAPGWFGTGAGDGDGPVVVLLAYCRDRGELTRTAAVMGAVTADEPEPDRYGQRYRRAIRRFGRVQLDAYTRIESNVDSQAGEPAA